MEYCKNEGIPFIIGFAHETKYEKEGLEMQSMTGYGRCSLEEDGRIICVEIRSVNHRFLDLNFRIPRIISFLEEDIRKEVSQRLNRGHVDVIITYENHRADAQTVYADIPLAISYVHSLQELSRAIGCDDEISLKLISELPNVLTVKEAEENEDAVHDLVNKALGQALNQLIEMRSREAQKLGADLLIKVNELRQCTQSIKDRAPYVVEEYREKLHTRLSMLLAGEVDEQRFLTEITLFADRVAIDEELVRLESHLLQIENLLTYSSPVGRKLDFLIQELNREVNTIGSKASDSQISQNVVACKGIIEKLREQVQNLE